MELIFMLKDEFGNTWKKLNVAVFLVFRRFLFKKTKRKKQVKKDKTSNIYPYKYNPCNMFKQILP